jgi:hypothetical protein
VGGLISLGNEPGFGYSLDERVFAEGLPVATIW